MRNTVDIPKYTAFLSQVLHRSGFCREDASRIAHIMVENEKLGISTHGSFHLSTYLKKIQRGSIHPKGAITIVSQGPTWANMDANGNLGFLAADKAMKVAMRKARESGMSLVTVKNSSHYGTGAFFERMAAENGMASIVCSNTWKLMAVPGSRGKVIGNSPIGYGFPAGEEAPVFFDIATSAASLTKVLRCAEERQPVPDGWIVDSRGLPTNDPTTPDYSLLPFGGHKGYGWAFFVEALTGMVSGGCCLSSVGQDWIQNLDVTPKVCHAFLVIDLRKLLGAGVFEKRMDACIRELHSAPKAEGSERIYVPGEIEAQNREIAEQNGIVLTDAHIARLREVSALSGVPLKGIFQNTHI